MGSEEMWRWPQRSKARWTRRSCPTTSTGDGAFYGPKIDGRSDAIGGSWQCACISDFNLPERFDLHYVGSTASGTDPSCSTGSSWVPSSGSSACS